MLADLLLSDSEREAAAAMPDRVARSNDYPDRSRGIGCAVKHEKIASIISAGPIVNFDRRFCSG